MMIGMMTMSGMILIGFTFSSGIPIIQGTVFIFEYFCAQVW